MKNIKQLFIITIIVVFSASIKAQEFGAPFLRNFSAEEYDGDTQNWAIVQDNRGVMFFANSSFVMEFDGTTWRNYYLDNQTSVMSLAVDSVGVVYMGGEGEFGCLIPNVTGKHTYVNLSQKIKDEGVNVTRIWQIVASNNGIYFFSFDKIFWWHDNELTIFSENLKPFFGFNINNRIYVRTQEDICLLNDTVLTPLENNVFDKYDAGYMRIVDYPDNKLLMISNLSGLITYDLNNNKIEKIESETDEYLKENTLYSASRIDENRIALGTFNGILIVDNHGKLLQVINENRGLASNTILGLFTDKDMNLWAAMQKGIACIDINYPATQFAKQQNIDNFVTDAIIYKGRKYVATFDGLYYLSDYKLTIENDNHAYRKFLDAQKPGDLKIINNKLFATGNLGLYQISDTTIRNIFPVDDISQISYNPKFPNYIFVFAKSSFVAIEIDWETNSEFVKVKSHKEFPEISEVSYYIKIDADNNFWLASYSKIFYIRINTIDDYHVSELTTESGLPESRRYCLTSIDGKINVSTNVGIYKPVFPGNNLPDSLITFEHDDFWGTRFTKDSLWATNIIKLSPNKYFINSSPPVLITKQNNGEIVADTNYLKKISAFRIGYTMLDDNGNINLGTPNSLWVFNPNIKNDIHSPYNCLLRMVTVTNDSLIFGGTFYNEVDSQKVISVTQTENLIPVIDYKHNSITFEYSAIFYENIEQTNYQYKLEGYNASWSKFSDETKAVYTNIPEGDYVFKVKAINVYGIESEISTFKFSVLPPWYRTWWAYSMYVILLGLLIFIIVKLSLRQVVKQKIKLEGIVEERTAEILETNKELKTTLNVVNQQKEEIQTQTEELESTNEKLVELDQFKESMTGMIVHDLKNPLNAIINVSKSVSSQKQVENTKQSGKQMLNMVMNILDVQKYEENEMVVDKIDYLLLGISQNAINDVAFLAKQKNITIDNKIFPETGIKADKEIVQRIFVNILTNAIKYTPDKGNITLSTTENSKDLICINITDTGQGIPANQISKIFDKFGQVSAKKSGTVRSTGLGLTFCKIAIEAHGGEIGVESVLEKGTTFWFTLQTVEMQPDETQQFETPVQIETPELLLNLDDKKLLKPFVIQFRKYKIYELSGLRKLLKQIEAIETENIKIWKDEMSKAIISGDATRYLELLSDDYT